MFNIAQNYSCAVYFKPLTGSKNMSINVIKNLSYLQTKGLQNIYLIYLCIKKIWHQITDKGSYTIKTNPQPTTLQQANMTRFFFLV